MASQCGMKLTPAVTASVVQINCHKSPNLKTSSWKRFPEASCEQWP